MRIGIFKKYVVNIILVVTIVFVSFVGIVSASDNSSSVVGPIYKAQDNGKVCLMVNVYWGNEYLPRMLEIFAENQVKTTFFVGGSWVEKNENLLLEIFNAGHEIANHGYFHKDHKKISYERNREEIISTHNLIDSVIGVKTNLFSPPSASYSDVTLKVAEELGYTTIMYSKDTIDWRDQDCSLILKRATKNVTGGDLILMHPTAATVSILPTIISKIKQKGLILSTVSDIISSNENNVNV